MHLICTILATMWACEDEANDCSALKTAHAGWHQSLSKPASPFTGKVAKISCIPTTNGYAQQLMHMGQ